MVFNFSEGALEAEQSSSSDQSFFLKHPVYNVSKKVDEDFCEKNFPQHHDFADGIFSIGCSCDLSITYGFEIMMAHESARHFFKFEQKNQFQELGGSYF